MELKYFLNSYGAGYISSRANPHVTECAKLSSEKARSCSGVFLAEGVKLAREALRYADVEELLLGESFVERLTDDNEFLMLAPKTGTKITVLSDGAFEKVSTERAPQGVIAVVKRLSQIHLSSGLADWQSGKRIIMLDEIRDPGNLGTIIRSAEALGINGVVLSGCADIYNPKTVRGAMGALFRMPVFIANGSDAAREIKKCGRRLIGAALGSTTSTLGEYNVIADDCVVIGNEGHGISDAVLSECDFCVKIPMAGECESLNASAAAVCIMWEYLRQLRSQG